MQDTTSQIIKFLMDPRIQALPPELFKLWVNVITAISANGGMIPCDDWAEFALVTSQLAYGPLGTHPIGPGFAPDAGFGIIPDDDPLDPPPSKPRKKTSAERMRRHRARKKTGSSGDVIPFPKRNSVTDQVTNGVTSVTESDANSSRARFDIYNKLNNNYLSNYYNKYISYNTRASDSDVTVTAEKAKDSTRSDQIDFSEAELQAATEFAERSSVPSSEIKNEMEKFQDYYLSRGQKLANKMAAWRNWCRSWKKFNANWGKKDGTVSEADAAEENRREWREVIRKTNERRERREAQMAC